MVNLSQYQTTPAIPEASSMIETFRAIGYSIETAVADIIDNAISADAKNIWINIDWKGSETWLAIKDDGIGMNNEELINAMRPGSKHPLEERKDNDLGRFGLGLKTASFSQCRKLTVISKKNNEACSYWTWDLDFVNETGRWELIRYIPSPEFEHEMSSLSSGTLVVWNDIDRLCNNLSASDSKALEKFLQTMELVKKHLAMVFHRYIENRKIKIWFQDRELTAWNPFMPDEPATQSFPEEPLFNGCVTVKGFILPHKSKLSDDKFRQGEGTKGWNGHQGFYIYRNERLLVAGDWLGLFRKEEHYKLSRIAIDLPNNLDAEWQIDIKKSVARPPVILKDQLKAYAVKLRSQAVEVYRHRGKTVRQLPGQSFVPFWREHKRGNTWLHVINRDHPIIEKIKLQAENNPDKAIELLLRFVEETIPIKSIYIKEAEEEDQQAKPFEGANNQPIQDLMIQIYETLIIEGRTKEQAKAVIVNLEPFNHFPELIETLY